ncbi:MAG: arginine--tRNA ligase [Candidatus Bipolaricaulaceae bacterium]
MRLEARVRAAVQEVLRELGAAVPDPIPIDRPPRPELGDLSTRVAFLVAPALRRPPAAIAEEVAGRLADRAPFAAVRAERGFVNFTLRAQAVREVLQEVLAAGNGYGRQPQGAGKAIQVEFVSSNPTGPLTVGHGRQAALGDVLAELYADLGWRVTREYYLNDEGRQMELLARSLWARYRQALGDDVPVPADGYHGDYLIPIGRELARNWGDRFPQWEGEVPALFRREAVTRMLAEIERDLDAIKVRFDVWTREGDLHRRGLVQETLGELRARDAVYERDGAVWMRSRQWGLSRDPVLFRSDGTPTYLMVDIAYHVDKFRRGFQRVVDVQGADHAEEQQQVKLALQILGLPDDFLAYCVHQFVTLKGRAGAERMSTRAGRFVGLRELVEELGPDVVRYFMVQRRPEAHLTFDYELARREGMDNPVYYVQYAHTRIASIFREAAETGQLPDDPAAVDLSPLDHPGELALIKELDRFPDVVVRASEFAPHLLCEYLEGLASLFHPYYAQVRVLGEGEATPARLALLAGVQLVLRRGLGILGVAAPETM